MHKRLRATRNITIKGAACTEAHEAALQHLYTSGMVELIAAGTEVEQKHVLALS